MKTKTDYITRQREAHHKALESLRASSCKLSGLQIWRKLRKLENVANAGATAYCNGETFNPYQSFGTPDTRLRHSPYQFGNDEKAWDCFAKDITDKIEILFGHVPQGFFVNGDPRGYALKLDPDKTPMPEGMDTDWGRNGILAAVIE